jgi:hypothetical protein
MMQYLLGHMQHQVHCLRVLSSKKACHTPEYASRGHFLFVAATEECFLCVFTSCIAPSAEASLFVWACPGVGSVSRSSVAWWLCIDAEYSALNPQQSVAACH